MFVIAQPLKINTMPKTPKNKAKINIQQPMMDEINPLLPFNQNPSLDSLEQIATEEIVKQHWLRQFKIWDSEEQSPGFFDEVEPWNGEPLTAHRSPRTAHRHLSLGRQSRRRERLTGNRLPSTAYRLSTWLMPVRQAGNGLPSTAYG